MTNTLYTTAGNLISEIPWEHYPRPQMRRDSYVNLNGYWDFAVSQGATPVYNRKILVPFCPESPLSGIQEHFSEGAALCYRRTFTLPAGFQQDRVLLHIGAADQTLKCYVNNKNMGSHSGGYEAMVFDITEALEETNTLELCCTDNLHLRDYPYGKQSLNRGGMWYTPVSGIWQSVWLESVPESYIRALQIENLDAGVNIRIEPALSGTVSVEGLGDFPLENGIVTITPEKPRWWSPDDPYLYNFTVTTDSDRVESYFAIRTISSQMINGIPRLLLNGKPYFFNGLLDQGYWPDGIYTPAAPDCYAQDIRKAKELGFNTLRKHIKVEAQEFYYQCDKQGMLVFQDMVNNGEYRFARDTLLPTLGIQKLRDQRLNTDSAVRNRFLRGMEATVRQLRNHPCIVYWTIFNEGWGQFDSAAVYDQLKALDASRIIDATSGWFRQKKSDVESLHIYFNLWHRLKKAKKPLMLTEFGGYACPIKGHLFNPKKAYGYKTCTTQKALQSELETLYRTRIVPAIEKGLCGAIYTQISDVEDEINGLLTYDRKVCKVDEVAMWSIAAKLQNAMQKHAGTDR